MQLYYNSNVTRQQIEYIDAPVLYEMKNKYEELGRQLTPIELNQLIKKFYYDNVFYHDIINIF